MSEQNPEMLAALQALLAQAQQQPAAAGGWQPPQPAQLPITGISIPVKVETPIGSVRVDLHFPAECGQSPQALQATIQALVQAGFPVDAWQSRGGQGGFGFGGNSGGYGGGYGNRGGYGGGGYGGGRRW